MGNTATVRCRQSGSWSPVLGKLECTEGVALITGGWYNHVWMNKVEVWGPDGLTKSLSDLPVGLLAHSMEFINGSVLLCGGERHVDKCLKGDYQSSSKGYMDINFNFAMNTIFKGFKNFQQD